MNNIVKQISEFAEVYLHTLMFILFLKLCYSDIIFNIDSFLKKQMTTEKLAE